MSKTEANLLAGQFDGSESYEEDVDEEFCVFDPDGNMSVQNTKHLIEKNYTKIPNRMKSLLKVFPVQEAKLAEHPTQDKRDDENQEDPELGINGIKNLGNTCYMNAALCCLFRIQPLMDYFLSNLHQQEINLTNPLGSKGIVTNAFSSLAK